MISSALPHVEKVRVVLSEEGEEKRQPLNSPPSIVKTRSPKIRKGPVRKRLLFSKVMRRITIMVTFHEERNSFHYNQHNGGDVMSEETPASWDPATEDMILSRQAFLKQGLSEVLRFLAEALPDSIDPDLLNASAKPLLRPPGALPEEAFLTTCEPYCTACREVCPKEAIFQDAFGFPFITPEVSPCVMCTDVPCTQVCPTDALTPLSDPRAIRMGTAVIDLAVCTAYQGSGCHVCYDVCPIPEEAIRLTEGLPEILPIGCTGCGVCVFHCPTPEAIFIKAPVQS